MPIQGGMPCFVVSLTVLASRISFVSILNMDPMRISVIPVRARSSQGSKVEVNEVYDIIRVRAGHNVIMRSTR